jgi:hypothetical protein
MGRNVFWSVAVAGLGFTVSILMKTIAQAARPLRQHPGALGGTPTSSFSLVSTGSPSVAAQMGRTALSISFFPVGAARDINSTVAF